VNGPPKSLTDGGTSRKWLVPRVPGAVEAGRPVTGSTIKICRIETLARGGRPRELGIFTRHAASAAEHCAFMSLAGRVRTAITAYSISCVPARD
jgi:hypothetical protein